MEICLQSKINILITPFQAAGSGALVVLITFDAEVVLLLWQLFSPASQTGLPREEFCFGSRLQVVLLPWQHSPSWQIECPYEGFMSAVEVLWTCFGISFLPADIEIFCSNGYD